VRAVQQWQPAQPPPGVPVLASWGRRLAALVVDNLIVLIPAALALVLAFAIGDASEDGDTLGDIGLIAFVLCVFIVPPIYFTYLIGREQGQTIGKRLLGIRVIDDATGGPIGYGRAFGRWLLVFVLGLVCGFLNILDGLWPLWDDRRQTWHDKAVRSVVVRLPQS
jgi:uncharacterized RDD family membrane protein YckC